MKKKLVVILVLTLYITFSDIQGLISFQYTYSEKSLGKQQNVDTKSTILKSSDFTPGPILIDDANPNLNWSKTATNNAWLSGNGSKENPYIIESVTIDRSGSPGNCIEVRNSEAYFIIRGSTLSKSWYRTSPYVIYAGIKLNNVKNGKIEDCVISNDNGYGIFLTNSQNNTVYKSTANNNKYYGLYIAASLNNISDNTVQNNRDDGIVVAGSYNLISNNTVSNNYYSRTPNLPEHGHGINLQWAGKNNITGNIVYNNEKAGIYLKDSSQNTLFSNVVFGNGVFNIRLDGKYGSVNSNNITSNTITNSKWGISLNGKFNIILGNIIENAEFGNIQLWLSHFNTITGNLIKNRRGIWIKESDNNEIYKNNVSDGWVGIYLELRIESSDNNLIYENYLKNNGDNAVDECYTNHWNNSEIGNFWDDYQGLDCDGDNIGETPYNINGHSIDYLPISKKDTYAPEIIIFSPSDNKLFGNVTPNYQIVVNEYILNITWYSINEGLTNKTILDYNGAINQSLWDLVDNGTVRIIFYAKDIAENIGSSEILVHKDIEAPKIKLITPSQNQFFEESPPLIEISLIEANVDKMWYTINTNPTKYYFNYYTTISSDLWQNLYLGKISITLYVNDTMGNQNLTQFDIFKFRESDDNDSDREEAERIPEFIILSSIIIGAISVGAISMVFFKKRRGRA